MLYLVNDCFNLDVYGIILYVKTERFCPSYFSVWKRVNNLGIGPINIQEECQTMHIKCGIKLRQQ